MPNSPNKICFNCKRLLITLIKLFFFINVCCQIHKTVNSFNLFRFPFNLSTYSIFCLRKYFISFSLCTFNPNSSSFQLFIILETMSSLLCCVQHLWIKLKTVAYFPIIESMKWIKIQAHIWFSWFVNHAQTQPSITGQQLYYALIQLPMRNTCRCAFH